MSERSAVQNPMLEYADEIGLEVCSSIGSDCRCAAVIPRFILLMYWKRN